jgi:CubicO group peptidase (beta-lactamase class C family)
MKELNHTLESFAKEHHFQGTLAIAKSGEILFSRLNGHCGTNKTCKLNTQDAIGSLTKQFTSVALLRVLSDDVCKGEDEGVKIALNKPLGVFPVA